MLTPNAPFLLSRPLLLLWHHPIVPKFHESLSTTYQSYDDHHHHATRVTFEQIEAVRKGEWQGVWMLSQNDPGRTTITLVKLHRLA